MRGGTRLKFTVLVNEDPFAHTIRFTDGLAYCTEGDWVWRVPGTADRYLEEVLEAWRDHRDDRDGEQ